jgi:hypothetical protein
MQNPPHSMYCQKIGSSRISFTCFLKIIPYFFYCFYACDNIFPLFAIISQTKQFDLAKGREHFL